MPTDAFFDTGKFDDSLFDTYYTAPREIYYPTRIDVTSSEIQKGTQTTSEIQKGTQTTSQAEKASISISE